MSRLLLGKFAVIATLVVLLLIPLSMVSGLISERDMRRQSVINEVQQTTSGAQRVTGPVLVIPYKLRTVETRAVQVWLTCGAEEHPDPGVVARARAICAKTEKTSGETVTVPTDQQTEVFSDEILAVPPDVLRIAGDVRVEALYRGRYEAHVYAATLHLSGSFAVDVGALANDDNVTFGDAYLALGVADVRGLRTSPSVKWREEPLAVVAGNDFSVIGNGVHAPLRGFDADTKASYPYELTFTVIGTQSLRFSPVGRDTKVELSADWPHPSFTGGMLPATRTVTDTGFQASWQTSWLATNMNRAFQSRNGSAMASQDFGVDFIQPINLYQQTTRATDYGILFVLLIFTAFFLFEVVARLPIHPVQYGLVGVMLATFYLVLIALSEHISFAAAYLAAASACVALAAFYVAHILRRWRRGLGFGALLAALYGALFVVLQSEDHALLLGAGLVFGAVAAVMVLTRRLDWYAVGSTVAAESPVGSGA